MSDDQLEATLPLDEQPDGSFEEIDYRAKYKKLSSLLNSVRKERDRLARELARRAQSSQTDEDDDEEEYTLPPKRTKPQAQTSQESALEQQIIQLQRQLQGLVYEREEEKLLSRPEYSSLAEARQMGILKSRADFPDLASYEQYLQNAANLLKRFAPPSQEKPRSDDITGATPPVANPTARPVTPTVRTSQEVADEMMSIRPSDPRYAELEKELKAALDREEGKQ